MAFGTDIGNISRQSEDFDLRQSWMTQKPLFNKLNEVFHFTVDACANDQNHLCQRYWTKQDSCMDHSWENERVFCNPPFAFTKTIIQKAPEAELCCFLLPLTCLTNRYMETAKPKAILCPWYRIKFDKPEALDCGCQPTLGSVILLYGDIQWGELSKIGFSVFAGL